MGQWPGGDPDEALSLYARRFDGLALEVDLLERRVRNGSVSPDEARSAVVKVREQVVAAHAVGDLETLAARLDALAPLIDEQRHKRRAEKAARLDPARATKESLVAEAEKIAAGTDWRAGVERMRTLMDRWKELPRLDRSADDALWQRFSAARSAYTRRRRQHYAEQQEQRRSAQRVKERLATEAESLAASTEWRPTAGRFRDLMREWKSAGPAPHREEEALWARFRAAQDTFFAARDAQHAVADAELAANAEVKQAILADAEELLPVSDIGVARAQLRTIAERWEAAGKVPRSQMQELEGRFRAVETAVKQAEENRWRRSNPEARARAETAVTQLEATLEKLRADAAKAEQAGNDRKRAEAEQAIAAREAWLVEARRALADFS